MEKKRIYQMGGVVEKALDENDKETGPYRVWAKDEDYPGLAMSRSIGDIDAKSVGVIPNPQIFEYTGIGYLGGKSINTLINAEADSTKVALTDYQRPNVTITSEKVNAYNLAQLLYMLEVQTAIAGELYNINTFNQPGVEQAKNYTYALMGRQGYEDSAETLKTKISVGFLLFVKCNFILSTFCR